MDQRIAVGIAVMLAVGGCAFLRQVSSDAQTGATAPLASGELSPEAAAGQLIEPLKGLPVVGSYAPFLLPVLVGFARYRRGRRIRLGKTRSKNPITGEWGEKVGVEGLVQAVANFATAMFEVGPDGSGLKRTWKTVAAGSVATLLMAIPGIQEWATGNAPAAAGLWTLVTAFVLGVEKELKKVLPVEEGADSSQPA